MCRSRRGISLVEVVVSTLLVGLLMTAALTSVGAAIRNANAAADSCDAVALARQLLEEITVLPYEDPNQTPGFGLESGETATGGARTVCDDLDDLKDWSDSPPRDRFGTPLTGFTGWQRTADAEKLKKSDKKLISDGATDEGLRLITVSVVSPSGRTTTLRAIRAKDAGSLQLQGVGQSLVTWVGVSLQSGAGNPVVSGVSLVNHAADQ